MTSDSNNSIVSPPPPSSSSSSSNIDINNITNPFRKNLSFSKKRIKSLNDSFNNLSIKSKFKNYSSSPSPVSSPSPTPNNEQQQQQIISSDSNPCSPSPSPASIISNINNFYSSSDNNSSIDDTSINNLSTINTRTSTITDTNKLLDDENKDLLDFGSIAIPSRTSSLRTIPVRDRIDTDSDKNNNNKFNINDNTNSTINTSLLSDTNSNQTFNNNNTTNILKSNNNNSHNHNHIQNHIRSNSNSNSNNHNKDTNNSKSYSNESKNKNNMNEIIKTLKEFKKLEHYLIKFNSIKKKNNINKTNILRLTLLPFLRTNSFSWSNLPYHLISDKLLLTSTNCLNKWWDSLLNALLDNSPQFQIPSLDKSVYLECISRIISRWEWMFLSAGSLSSQYHSNEIFNPILIEFKNLLLKTLEYSISRLNLKKVSLSISALVGKVFAYSFFHLPEVSKGLLFLLNSKLIHYENFYNYSILEKNQYSLKIKNFKNNLKFNNNLKLKNLKFQKKLIKISKKFPIHLNYLINSTINIRKTKFKHEKYLFNSIIPPSNKIKGINDTKGLWVKRWCSLDNTDVFCSFLRHYFAISSFYFNYNDNNNIISQNSTSSTLLSTTSIDNTSNNINDNDKDSELNCLSILALPGYMFILTHIYEIIDYSMAKHVRTLNSMNNGQKDPNIKILATGYSLQLNNTYLNSTDPRKLNQQLSKLLRVIRDFLHNSRSSYEIKMSKQVINSFDLVTQSIAVEIGIPETVKSSLIMDYWGRFIENVNLDTPNILDTTKTDSSNQSNSTTTSPTEVTDSSNPNSNQILNDSENIENCSLTINNGINWIFWCDVIIKLILSENTTCALKSLSTLFQIWEYIPNHLPIKPLDTHIDNDINKPNQNIKNNIRVWISNPNESIRFNLSCWLLSISTWKLLFCHWLPLVRSYYMRLICWRLLGIRTLLSDENLSNLIELNNNNMMTNGDNFDTDNSLFDENNNNNNNNSHLLRNSFNYLSTLDPNGNNTKTNIANNSSNNLNSSWLGSYNNSLDPNCEAIRLMVKNRLEISFKCVKSMIKVSPYLDLKPCDPLANKKLIIIPCNSLAASTNSSNNINGSSPLLSNNSETFASPFENYSNLNPYALQSQEINNSSSPSSSSSSLVNQIQSPLAASNESSFIRTHPYEIFDDAVYSCASLPFGSSSVATPDSKNSQSVSPSLGTDSVDPNLHRSSSFSNSKTPERVSRTSSFISSNSPVNKFTNSLTGLSSSSSSNGGSVDKKEAISNGLASAFKMFKNIRSSSSSGNLLKRQGKSSNNIQESTDSNTENNNNNNKINTPLISVDTTNMDYDSPIPFDSDYQGGSTRVNYTSSSTLLTSTPPPPSSVFKVSNSDTAILDVDDNLLKLQNNSPVDEFESQITSKLNSISTPIPKPFSTLSMSSKSSSPSLLSLKTPSSPSSSLSSSTADLNSIFKEEINLSKAANPPPPPELNKRTLELAPPIYKFKLVTDEEIVSKRNGTIHFLNMEVRQNTLAYDHNMNRTMDLPTVTNTESLEGLDGVDIISFSNENSNMFQNIPNNGNSFNTYQNNGNNNNNTGNNNNNTGNNPNFSYLKGIKKQRLPTLLKINSPNNDLSSTRGLIALISNSDSCTKSSPYSLNANNSDLSVSTFTYRDEIKNNRNSGQYQVNGGSVSQQRPIYSGHMYSHTGSNGDNYTVHDGIVDDEEEEYDQSDDNDADDDDDDEEEDDEDNVLRFSIDRRNTILTSRSLIRKGNGNILFNTNDSIGTIQKLGNLGKALNEWSIAVDEFEEFTRAKLFTNGDCSNIDLENLKSFNKLIPILISETTDKLNGY
ncbi:hypothetical protein B5S32_g5087 [[Candida] boidinii]|nr:hypothetical protein B5S32_g5087 [[Candida] boidinii]